MKCWIIHLITASSVAAGPWLDASRRANIESTNGVLSARHIDHKLWRRKAGQTLKSDKIPRAPGISSSARRGSQDAGPSDSSQRTPQAGSSSLPKSRSPDNLTRQIEDLRITQSSGAEPSSSRQDSKSPRRGKISSPQELFVGRSPPSAGNSGPNTPLHVSGQATTPPSRSTQASSGGGQVLPASDQGPRWLQSERQRLQEWRARAARMPNPNDSPRNSQAKVASAASTVIADRLKPQAKAARRQDDQDLQKYREMLATGAPAHHPMILSAKRQSKDSSFLAHQLTQSYSHAEEAAAITLANSKQFGEAAIHAQKADRAYQRAILRMQHAETLDMKWMNQAAKESIKENIERPAPERARAVSSAIGIRKHYKTSAEAYHQSFKDYQQVRHEFDGSSSDESEKSTFDDIVPKADEG